MPIYEFYCDRCHTIFNFFSRSVKDGLGDALSLLTSISWTKLFSARYCDRFYVRLHGQRNRPPRRPARGCPFHPETFQDERTGPESPRYHCLQVVSKPHLTSDGGVGRLRGIPHRIIRAKVSHKLLQNAHILLNMLRFFIRLRLALKRDLRF